MKDISLKELLEAGCHFGHKADRWHPKASFYIFDTREGIHIIDLVKTRDLLKKACEYVYGLGKDGKTLMMVATKRQAKQIVADAAKKSGASYLVNRWVGGFLTNWDEVKKNIDKLNTMKADKTSGAWQKRYVKHEIVKLDKTLRQIDMVYGGVANLQKPPDAVFVIDIKREEIAVGESVRRNIPVIAIVDTNTNPTPVNYPIPANDDAIGSLQLIVSAIEDAYREGWESREKDRTSEKPAVGEVKPAQNPVLKQPASIQPKKASPVTVPAKTPAEPPKKRPVKKARTSGKKSDVSDKPAEGTKL